MADRGSRDRQPALCPFPGVDDGRPGWWSRCHTTLRCPGTSAFSPGALPCPLSRPQVAGRHPSASQALGHGGWGEARELMFCWALRAPGQTSSEEESWGEKCPEEVTLQSQDRNPGRSDLSPRKESPTESQTPGLHRD